MITYVQQKNSPLISGEATVYFSVDDIEPPKITLNWVNHVTFNQTSIPLVFTTSAPTSWMGYCLDNGTEITITGNTTLTVAPGHNTITLYANDSSGNTGQSEIVHFKCSFQWCQSKNTDESCSVWAWFNQCSLGCCYLGLLK